MINNPEMIKPSNCKTGCDWPNCTLHGCIANLTGDPVMTTYYLKDGKLFGPLDRMPPDKNDYFGFMGEDEVFDVESYDNDIESFLRYLSSAPTIPHTFSGHSRVVPEGEIEWRYEVKLRDKWEEFSKEGYEQATQSYPKRRVATPKITEGPELPNLSASTANLSQIKDKDEWLKDVRGEEQSIPAHIVDDMKLDSYYDGFKDGQAMTGNTSTSGEEAKPEFDGNWDGNAVDDLIKENEKLRELLTAQPDKQAIDRLIDKMDEGDVKITFGLQERHIKRINEQAKKWGENKHLAVYSTHFWDNLAKEFAWEPFTLALYYFNHTNNPPSPQTGDKDEGFQIRVLKLMIEKLCGCYETMFERYSGLESLDLETVREYLGPLNGMRGMLRDWDSKITSPHQPPAAQSDQEAGNIESIANEIFPDIKNEDSVFKDYSQYLHAQRVRQVDRDKFVIYMQRMQSNQTVYAVAFGIWLSKNYIAAVEDGYIGLKDKQYHTTADLYALFTARHPTPKPDSHNPKSKKGDDISNIVE